jgi:hypothetical protein
MILMTSQDLYLVSVILIVQYRHRFFIKMSVRQSGFVFNVGDINCHF